MRRWLLVPALLLGTPAWAGPAVRAVFVGVDDYLYSETKVKGAGFADLHGAVGDVGRIKDALAAAYGLDLDRPAGDCRSANAVSVTLTDHCATRAAILAALDERIDASAAGDTLVFYFAGHGSQIVDDQLFDQASGMNDTILPTDARQPGAAVEAEILDREIKVFVDRATANGVNVVTIFDSCHSGTATRAPRGGVDPGQPRYAPVLVRHGVTRAAAAPAKGAWTRGAGRAPPGYRVHLAAAADSEQAREVAAAPGAIGRRAGVFTTALAATLTRMPSATFGDIAAETRLLVMERGSALQTPQAEGALSARFGRGRAGAALYDASPNDGSVTLTGGLVAGMTRGSRFALFAGSTAALEPGSVPLATGAVSRVDATSATLRLESAVPLPGAMVAREVEHAPGDTVLLLRNAGDTATDRRLIADAVAGMKGARIAEPALLMVVTPPKRRDAVLLTHDLKLVARLGAVDDAAFAERLREALGGVSRAQGLLTLHNVARHADVGFCVDGDTDHDPFGCAAPGKTVKVGQPAKVSVVNAEASPRCFYVLAIDQALQTMALMPPEGSRDPPVGAGQPLQRSFVPTSAGRYRFVALTTAPPAGDGDCPAASGTRDAGAGPGADLTASVADVSVIP